MMQGLPKDINEGEKLYNIAGDGLLLVHADLGEIASDSAIGFLPPKSRQHPFRRRRFARADARRLHAGVAAIGYICNLLSVRV